MTRLLLFCGSQRRASLNARLLDEVARLVPDGVTLDMLPPNAVDLPLFDQDREEDPTVRGRLAILHARFAAADALILASPEYNGLMTPYLKNLIDWVSRLPMAPPMRFSTSRCCYAVLRPAGAAAVWRSRRCVRCSAMSVPSRSARRSACPTRPKRGMRMGA